MVINILSPSGERGTLGFRTSLQERFYHFWSKTHHHIIHFGQNDGMIKASFGQNDKMVQKTSPKGGGNAALIKSTKNMAINVLLLRSWRS